MRVEDVQFFDKGMSLTIRSSKTDQEGGGQAIPVNKGSFLRVVERLQMWLHRTDIQNSPIFRPISKSGRLRDKALNGRSVALILKHYVSLEGLEPDDFAGHSLRLGFFTSAARHLHIQNAGSIARLRP